MKVSLMGVFKKLTADKLATIKTLTPKEPTYKSLKSEDGFNWFITGSLEDAILDVAAKIRWERQLSERNGQLVKHPIYPSVVLEKLRLLTKGGVKPPLKKVAIVLKHAGEY